MATTAATTATAAVGVGAGPTVRTGDTPFSARGPGERRNVAVGRGGMVAAAHPLAVAAGLWALGRGGNAMDTALAAAWVTGVVLPGMCGVGGDCFILHYDAKSQKVTSVNGSGAAPLAASLDEYNRRGHVYKMPTDGPLSVSVPGAVRAYYDAHERWGSIRMADLIRPAESYARAGFALTPDGAATITNAQRLLKENPGDAAKTFLRKNGTVPRPGDLLKNEDLADTLALIGTHGPKAVYGGKIADALGKWMAKHGGLMTADDLARHASEIAPAISTAYRGNTVHVNPPVSQGIILLAELNILENANLAEMGHLSPDALHLMVETKKLAYADRNRYAGDPRFVDLPLTRFTDPAYGSQQYAAIDPRRARTADLAAFLPESGGDTTYLCVVDAAGNAVSLIHSLSAAFGSGCLVPGTGITLNNRAGRGFTLQPGHPNALAPGKRTMHTLNSYVVTRADGSLALVGGTPGGDGQPQWNMQILTCVFDYGLSPQEAIEAPRWLSFPGTDPANLPNPYELRVESRLPAETVAALRARGHFVKTLPEWGGSGAAQVIAWEGGTAYGGSDPRTEGVALGL